MRKYHSNEQGFTLPEMFVVTGVIVIMVIVTAALLRPITYSAEMHDAQRHTDVARLAQALKRYKTDNGQFPPNIPPEEITIGSSSSQYALCPLLVPKYLKDLPLDPEAGSKYRLGENTETTDACNAQDVQYSADYSLKRDDKGAVTVSAPAAKQGKIEITIQ